MIDNKKISLPERKIKVIKPNKISTKIAADLLTRDEIEALIEKCQHSRDLALLITMYERGFMVGEMV